MRNQVHRHDFHELFVIAHGTGTHMIDLQHWEIDGPCLHIVRPGQVHQLDRSSDMQGAVVMFRGDAELGHGKDARAELFGYADVRQAIPLDLDRYREAMDLVVLLEKELERPEGPMPAVMEGFLGNLLIKSLHWVRAANDEGTPTDRSGTTRQFLELLEKGFLSERSVGHYADRLAITPDHLNEKIRKRTGRTASAMIQERLLLEAKRLLLHSDLSVKEVGYALNMKDPAYFSRWFLKMAGSSPSSFRQAVRDKYKD